MSEPKHEKRDAITGEKIVHEYDGIEECDHQLPRWWLWTLYGSMIFAAIYWLDREAFRVTDSERVALAKERERIAAAAAERMKNAGDVTPELLADMAKNPTVVQQGKSVFSANCIQCHHETAGGNTIGPNLTDEYWLHGGTPDKVYASVAGGWQSAGMPEWRKLIGEEKVRLVAAYVVSIRNSNVPGGKGPQGTREP